MKVEELNHYFLKITEEKAAQASTKVPLNEMLDNFLQS